MKSYLPAEILARKDKIGFETPEQKWIKNSSDWTFEILNSNHNAATGINIDALRKEFKQVFDNKLNYTEEHWRYLNFLKWADIYNVTF